jgi:hypothetical protein
MSAASTACLRPLAAAAVSSHQAVEEVCRFAPAVKIQAQLRERAQQHHLLSACVVSMSAASKARQQLVKHVSS